MTGHDVSAQSPVAIWRGAGRGGRGESRRIAGIDSHRLESISGDWKQRQQGRVGEGSGEDAQSLTSIRVEMWRVLVYRRIMYRHGHVAIVAVVGEDLVWLGHGVGLREIEAGFGVIIGGNLGHFA